MILLDPCCLFWRVVGCFFHNQKTTVYLFYFPFLLIMVVFCKMFLKLFVACQVRWLFLICFSNYGFELSNLSDPVCFLWDFSLSLFGIDGLCLLWHFRVTCCHIICVDFQLPLLQWDTTFLHTSPLKWSKERWFFFCLLRSKTVEFTLSYISCCLKWHLFKTVFTESSSFDCTLLPFTLFTGIRADKISLTFPTEKTIKKLLGTIKKCLIF